MEELNIKDDESQIFCADSSPTSPQNAGRGLGEQQQTYGSSPQKSGGIRSSKIQGQSSQHSSKSMSSEDNNNNLSKQFYGQTEEYSRKKVPHSLMNVLPEEPLPGSAQHDIPEAMPLIRKISLLNSREPDIYQKLKRGLTKQYTQLKEPCCQHEEEIIEWKCQKCKSSIAKFNHIFDDQQGKVKTFTRIVYENSFLQDFRDSFKSNPMVLYTQYQPQNVLELKEYMFMIMCDQMKQQKSSPFGTGQYQSLSGRLLKYMTHHQEKNERIGPGILQFDSLFESGNLLQAEKSSSQQDTYNLYMQVDTNTRGHQQWFYFRVKGGKKGKTYTFQIMNFTKPGVTGGRGYKGQDFTQRIKVKSKNKERWEDLTNKDQSGLEYVKTDVTRRKKDVIAAGQDSDQEDWVEEAFSKPEAANAANPSINLNGPTESTIQQKPQVQVQEKKKRRTFYYYALKFKYTFEFDDDEVFFAFSEPITLTEILTELHDKEKLLLPRQLVNDLENKKKQNDDLLNMITNNTFQKQITIENSQKLIYYQRSEICRTLSGLPIYKIVISRDQKSAKKNQIVLITSRVHSGESPGSQVFTGIYNFITSDSREAKYLRRFYTFILVPCMNPDGVVIGNYRNSLAGVDLNRQWINPEPEFHPEVCAVKNLMQQIKEEDKRQIWIYCDLHGHSKKKNSFFYGCNTAANGGFLSWTIVRLLPRIFAQKTHMFNYKDCRFRVEPYKIGTARIVAWKQFQITHSFTLENSFYGYDIGEDESRIFNPEDYNNIGLKFTMSIYEMHLLWKQIRRELQVTHGWLKPRTLNEMTGVPAAQLKAEETAQQKEEERKKKAIEQYEQFLKTFYKSQPPILQKRKNQAEDAMGGAGKYRNQATESSAQKPSEERSSRPLAKAQKPVGQNNSDIEEVYEKEESEYMFKLHQGLVKIQALIRGFLARIRVKKIQMRRQNTRLNKSLIGNSRIPRQRSNQILKNSSSKMKIGRGLNPPSQMLFDTSSDHGLKLAAAAGADSSNEENLMRSNTEQINVKNLSDSGQSHDNSGKMVNSFNMFGKLNVKADWREYFEGDELDKAYQIVEVEQRDETDQESNSSMGSNSNPSEDNFDEEEVYRNVYRVKNPAKIIEQRKQKEQEFIEKVQKEVKTQADIMASHQRQKEKDEDQGVEKSQLQHQQSVVTNKLNFSQSQEKIDQNTSKQEPNQNSQEDDSQYFQTPYSKMNVDFDSFTQKTGLINSTQMQKQRSGNHSPIAKTDIQHDNIFQNVAHQGRRMLKTSNQQRAFTQQQNNYISNMNLNNQAKVTQQTFKIQPNFSHKKENINQVIKDCFITKKMNTKNSSYNVAKSVSPNKAKIAKQKQQQFNLKMSHLTNQFSVSQAGFGLNTQTRKSQQPQQQQQQQKSVYIEEALINQNNVLLQKIIQMNLKNQNFKLAQRINLQKHNEQVTIQLLQKLNQQMNGMNTLQANQYMQIVLMHMLQTNKQMHQAEMLNQFYPSQSEIDPFTNPGRYEDIRVKKPPSAQKRKAMESPNRNSLPKNLSTKVPGANSFYMEPEDYNTLNSEKNKSSLFMKYVKKKATQEYSNIVQQQQYLQSPDKKYQLHQQFIDSDRQYRSNEENPARSQNDFSQEIVNTKELINEIKQMRVHQQIQLQLQQQLQQQFQQMNKEQQQFVQFNQINYYDNQSQETQNYANKQFQKMQNQGFVRDMMQHLNNNPKKKLQAEDKIPQGLQALMNKQANMHQIMKQQTSSKSGTSIPPQHSNKNKRRS